MTHSGFYNIRQIDEESNGLRITLEEAPPGCLPKDHPRFQEFRDLLRHQLLDAQKQGVRRPTWLGLDDDHVIREVRMVGKSVPLSASRDESGGYWIVFPLMNRQTRLAPEHPRFREFEQSLQFALENQTPLYYVACPDNRLTIDDMMSNADEWRTPAK